LQGVAIATESLLDKSTFVDTFTIIDTKGDAGMGLCGRAKTAAVEFCERCAEVCDGGCRRAALRERALVRALRYGGRV